MTNRSQTPTKEAAKTNIMITHEWQELAKKHIDCAFECFAIRAAHDKDR